MGKRGKKITPAENKRIHKLLENHGVSAVASAVDRSESVIYKIRKKDRHFSDLASIALVIADNLEKFRKHASYLSPGDLIGNVMFEPIAVSLLADLDLIEESKADDVLVHLKNDFPALKKIRSWSELPYGYINPDFINRVRVKAYNSDFKGLCRHCPGVTRTNNQLRGINII